MSVWRQASIYSIDRNERSIKGLKKHTLFVRGSKELGEFLVPLCKGRVSDVQFLRDHFPFEIFTHDSIVFWETGRGEEEAELEKVLSRLETLPGMTLFHGDLAALQGEAVRFFEELQEVEEPEHPISQHFVPDPELAELFSIYIRELSIFCLINLKREQVAKTLQESGPILDLIQSQRNWQKDLLAHRPTRLSSTNWVIDAPPGGVNAELWDDLQFMSLDQADAATMVLDIRDQIMGTH